jgi:hypothetical protein
MRPATGLYYREGSLKARLCVEGRRLLYAFCERHSVPHARLGKLVVAAGEAQLGALRALAARGAANGVPDLRLLSAGEVAALEPGVRCAAGLLSPSTGILDSHRWGGAGSASAWSLLAPRCWRCCSPATAATPTACRAEPQPRRSSPMPPCPPAAAACPLQLHDGAAAPV